MMMKVMVTEPLELVVLIGLKTAVPACVCVCVNNVWKEDSV